MSGKLWVIWSRILDMAHTPMDDPTSWVAHWVIVAGSTGVIGGVMGAATGHGVLWALWASEAWAVFFVAREVANYLMHEYRAHDMRRWTLDGAMDLLGPVLHHVLWWVVYLV